MKHLKVPCTYQGGKQRIAKDIASILKRFDSNDSSIFYDLCCGSGAISIELINQGVSPDRIKMIDLSTWGKFWETIARRSFDLNYFRSALDKIPAEKERVRSHLAALASQDPGQHQAEIYLILQSGAFGGKQLWWDGYEWRNAFFRKYWLPTENSVRRSPANTMQPNPIELLTRVSVLYEAMNGITASQQDVSDLSGLDLDNNSIIYIDPPYHGTTPYGFSVDIQKLVQSIREKSNAPIFVSESKPLNSNSIEITLGGANGGISGNRSRKHREWLTRF